jgi:predicted DsbA family dithiol-disulfide isomerase
LAQDRFFAGEINPFDPQDLVATAESLGLPGPRVREVLAGDQYADAVRADLRAARELGVRGVPFAVFGRRYAVSGAQPVEVYAQALDQAVA